MNRKTLLLFAVWLAFLNLCRGEEGTNTFTLASGEILTIESRQEQVGRDTIQHNRLFLVQSPASSREYVGDIGDQWQRHQTSLLNNKPSIFRSGQRVVLVFGKYVFKRSEHNRYVVDMSGGQIRIRPPMKDEDRPTWNQFNTDPTPPASLFLRSFLPTDDTRVGQDDKRIDRPQVSYTFDKVDLENNTLTTHRDTAEDLLPKVLVYANKYYEDGWEFDLERTRAANALSPPPETNLLVDVSVITYPGDIRVMKDRSAALSVLNAREAYAGTLPLSAKEWRGGEYSLVLPNGTNRTESYKILLGFADNLPGCFHVLWETPPLNPTWHFIKIGEWDFGGSSATKDNLAIWVFLRIRRAS